MKTPTRSSEPSFVLTMPMGLDGVACEELSIRAPGASLEAHSSTELRLKGVGDSGALLAMRSINDAWVVLRDFAEIGPRYRDLHTLTSLVSRTSLEPVLSVTERSGRMPRTPTFSLTCSMRDERAYRRLDALKAVEDGLTAHTTWKLRPTGGPATLRLWLHLEGDNARLCAAMAPRPLHLRTRAVSLPASLPGPVAYAMAQLTRPLPDDVFVDPTCGSGSIALERAENWRHQYILAGDVSGTAVAATAANFGPRHKPRAIMHWDAAALPLPPKSVDALASNPPHGIQIQVAGGLEELYRGLLTEAARVLRPGGRMTFLTPLRDMTDRLLNRGRRFHIERCFVIDLLGQRPYLYVLQRR